MGDLGGGGGIAPDLSGEAAVPGRVGAGIKVAQDGLSEAGVAVQALGPGSGNNGLDGAGNVLEIRQVVEVEVLSRGSNSRSGEKNGSESLVLHYEGGVGEDDRLYGMKIAGMKGEVADRGERKT